MFLLSLLLHLSVMTVTGLKFRGPAKRFHPPLSYSVGLVEGVPANEGGSREEQLRRPMPEGSRRYDLRGSRMERQKPSKKGREVRRESMKTISPLREREKQKEEDPGYLESRLAEIRRRISYMDVQQGEKDVPLPKQPAVPFPGSQVGPTSSVVDPAFASYLKEIWEKVSAAWRAPIVGREKKGLETVVIVSIRRDGRITHVDVEKRSGDFLYDEAVLRVLKKIDPLPPFPPNLREETIEIGLRFLPGGVS